MPSAKSPQTSLLTSPKVRTAKRYKIDVTAADIAHAIPRDSSICAVARAIARAIPDTTRIVVDTQAIRFSRGSQRFIYLTPAIAQHYVVEFDAGRPIEPFSFRLAESQLLPIRQSVLTPAGKAIQRAENAAAYAARTAAKRTGRDPRKAANEARRSARATARAQHTGKAVIERAGRRAAPQVFRNSKERVYGSRRLRINQQNAPNPITVERATAEVPTPSL
jgi:hypothetical protein